MSRTVNAVLASLAIATSTLTAGAGFASAAPAEGTQAESRATVVDHAETKPPTSVTIPGVRLPGVDAKGLEVGPDGVAIGGPTIGLPW